MVAIPQYKVCQITLMPTVEIAGVIVCGFMDTPHVESLIHHHEAHTVAKVEQFGRRRVMRATDTVAAHLLQLSPVAS